MKKDFRVEALVKQILLLTFVIGAILSCDNDEEILTNDGVLIWSGNYEVDGCGFFLIIHDTKYKPVNESIIDESFETDSTDVSVEYVLLKKEHEYICGLHPPRTIDGLKIISIKRK